MAIVVDEPIINSPVRRADPPLPDARRARPSWSDARARPGFTPGLRTRGGQGTLLEEEYVELPLVNDIRTRVRALARGRPSGREPVRRSTCSGTGRPPGANARSSSASSKPRRRRSGWSRARRGDDRRLPDRGAGAVRPPLPEDGDRLRQDRRHGDAHRLERPQQGAPAAGPPLQRRRPGGLPEPDRQGAAGSPAPGRSRPTTTRRSTSCRRGLRAALLAARSWSPTGTCSACPTTPGGAAIVQRGRPSAGAFANLVLRADLGSKGNLLVINDEAHHAWRARPRTSARREGPRLAGEVATAGRLADEEEEARVWLNGLALIHEARGINRALDFSATPYYLSGSGHAEGEPFGWIVADFSLLDAIESGIVKVPRDPGRRQLGRPRPALPRPLGAGQGHACRSAPRAAQAAVSRDDRLLDEIEGALATLASAWKGEFERWRAEGRLVPPAMIVVCDQTATAERVADFIGPRLGHPGAGQSSRANRIGRCASTRRSWPRRRSKPEAGQTKEQAAEALRLRVATVGQARPRRAPTCAASCPWRCSRRAGTPRTSRRSWACARSASQLLCEQVVGAGLRRSSYDDMSVPEYVDVYGIPFQAFPIKGERRGSVVPPPCSRPWCSPCANGPPSSSASRGWSATSATRASASPPTSRPCRAS